MTAPNIKSPTTINGKSAVQLVGASPTAIISNAAGSGKVLRVNSLYVGNVDTATAYDLTIDLYRSSVAYRFGPNISCNAKQTLDVLSKAIYLEEGDTLRLTASSASKLEAVASYEEIS